MTNRAARRSEMRTNDRRRGIQRNTRRGWWRFAPRVATAAAVVALVALVVLAYRAAGGGSGASPDTMVSRDAPDFTLPTLDGQQVSLSDFRGEKNVLLFFNEGYGCDPCWQQALALQQNLEKYTEMETEVFAVMVDPPDLLRREASRWGITLPILVDATTGVAQSYDALGGMHANKPNHTFVLISKEGKISWAQDYASMWVDNESVVRQIQGVAAQ